MTFQEFSEDKKETVLLIHPSIVRWDYFEYVIPLLADRYHLIIPALPGYDNDLKSDFSSVEELAQEMEEWLSDNGITELSCIYGCSMGGSIVIKMLSNRRLKYKSAVIDGGITPYQLPWILTRFIALKDFLLIYMGKLGGVKILEKAFSTDEFSKEDIEYAAEVLSSLSNTTIWNTFDSCNNYKMPEEVKVDCEYIEYWYAKKEEKDRKWDIKYMKKKLPDTEFRVFEDVGHGGMAISKPELLASELERVMRHE